MPPSLLSAATVVALADPEREKRWRNKKDTVEEYCASHGIQVFIGATATCAMIHVPDQTTYSDVYRHVRRCLNLEPSVAHHKGLGFIERFDNLEPFLEGKIQNFAQDTFVLLNTATATETFVPDNAALHLVMQTAVKRLYIESPRTIEISLADIRRVVRSPTGTELCEQDAQELLKMLLHFEIASSEEENVDEENVFNFDPETFILLNSGMDRNQLIPEGGILLNLVTGKAGQNYDAVELAMSPPVSELYIESPRTIEISLADIQRVVRSPTGTELSEEDAHELRKMLLYFEIAFSEEKDEDDVSNPKQHPLSAPNRA
ncbi:hypothetical protein RQP46_003769 [Phenoliferia psychrophenolica]